MPRVGGVTPGILRAFFLNPLSPESTAIFFLGGGDHELQTQCSCMIQHFKAIDECIS